MTNMDDQYMVSIKIEVLLEVYADILSRLINLLEKKGISPTDQSNFWARMYKELCDENDKLLSIRSFEEAGKAEGIYLFAKSLIEGESE